MIVTSASRGDSSICCASALAAALAFVAWEMFGGRGLAVAVSATAFWLMLQFNRTVRVMKVAAQHPLGQVPSAVMFQAGLRPGLTMLQIVATTRSLGRKVDGVITSDWEAAACSANLGGPISQHRPRSKIVRDVAAIAEDLITGGHARGAKAA